MIPQITCPGRDVFIQLDKTGIGETFFPVTCGGFISRVRCRNLRALSHRLSSSDCSPQILALSRSVTICDYHYRQSKRYDDICRRTEPRHESCHPSTEYRSSFQQFVTPRKAICSSHVTVYTLSIDISSAAEWMLILLLYSAAWHGTRIILRQVSPESPGIFDLLLEIHAFCSGDWEKLARECGITQMEIEAFLDYGAIFLSNVGNYYVRH